MVKTKKVMVDANVLLTIILEESLCEKCKENLDSLIENGEKIYLTPIIIQEIMDRIDDELKKQGGYRREMVEKINRQQRNRFLFALKKYFDKSEILSAEGGDFNDLNETCHRELSRIGKNEFNDKLNIAIAISNSCTDFLTKDKGIIGESKNVKKISNNKLNIWSIR